MQNFLTRIKDVDINNDLTYNLNRATDTSIPITETTFLQNDYYYRSDTDNKLIMQL